jgi:hypothetical protein
LETGSAVEVGLEEVVDEVQEVEVGRRMVEKEERGVGVTAE